MQIVCFKNINIDVFYTCLLYTSNECIRPKRFYEWRSKLLRKGGFIPVKVNSKGLVSLPHKEKSLLSAPPVLSLIHIYPENKYCFYRVGFYDNIMCQDRMSLYVEIGLSLIHI